MNALKTDKHKLVKQLFWVWLFLFVISGCSQGDKGQRLSGEAPDFKLAAVDGSMVSLSDYSGKVIVVDFWATWCPPCLEMIPVLSKLHRQYANKGLVVLGVSLDQEGLDVLGAFVHENMIPYKILMGDKRITRAFGGISSIPTLYIIDREGRLVRKLAGYHSFSELEEQVKRYL